MCYAFIVLRRSKTKLKKRNKERDADGETISGKELTGLPLAKRFLLNKCCEPNNGIREIKTASPGFCSQGFPRNQTTRLYASEIRKSEIREGDGCSNGLYYTQNALNGTEPTSQIAGAFEHRIQL